MENELTKRKWKAKEYEARFDEGVLIIDENNMLVAIVIDECVPYSEEKAIANAKLIAAAPDLLNACICESILNNGDRQKAIIKLEKYGYKGFELPQDFVDSLRIQAIKKATE